MATGLPATYLTGIGDVLTTDKEGVGKIRFNDGKWYKWCLIKNTTATVALAAGDPVAYDAEDGYENNHVVADLTDADSSPFCAGCATGTVTGTAGTSYWSWIQIKGLVTVVAAITSGADGVPVYLTTTDKTFAKAVEADSAADYKQVAGIAMDSSAKKVVLDCPF